MSRGKTKYSIRLRRRDMILGVLVLCVAGALVYRVSHAAGMAITLAAISAYLVVDMMRTLKRVRNFKRTDASGKVRLAMWCALLFVALSAWIGGEVSYFLLLVLLAVDYLMSEPEKHGNEKK